MIATGSDDRTVRLWDIDHGGKQIQCFNDHTGMINDVKFHPDGTCLASCGTDKKIKIFDCRSQRLLQHYDAHDDAVNSISFNSQGTHLISTSNDSSIKIWDLKKGCIIYTLFGHEGASTSAAFSPLGDYFCTGGNDSVVLAWKSNLNPVQQEDLSEIQAKIETEVFVTQKERVDKIPESRTTKIGKNKENKSTLANQNTHELEPNESMSDMQNDSQLQPKKLVSNGLTYRKLKPEVKQTLEKVVYQLELVAKTLQLMEQRVMDSEDKLQEVMNYIKTNDLEFVSSFCISIGYNLCTLLI